ncbi:hypothetical protein ABPG77_006706 [Micractinium sp. CCAP 211/92]
MRVSNVLLAAFAFVLGYTAGTRWEVRTTPVGEALTGVLSKAARTRGQCADIYKGAPLSTVIKVEELQPGKHPIPGFSHITLAGFKQHGMKGLELWLQTFAPGSGTPIHRHDCEETFLILSGTGTAAIQGKDGAVVEAQVGPNSTFTVLPNARHQLRNQGSEDFHVVVAINNPPFRPFIYNSWDEPYAAGKEFYPIFWDAECPEHVPAALARLAGAGGGKVQPSGASSEL